MHPSLEGPPLLPGVPGRGLSREASRALPGTDAHPPPTTNVIWAGPGVSCLKAGRSPRAPGSQTRGHSVTPLSLPTRLGPHTPRGSWGRLRAATAPGSLPPFPCTDSILWGPAANLTTGPPPCFPPSRRDDSAAAHLVAASRVPTSRSEPTTAAPVPSLMTASKRPGPPPTSSPSRRPLPSLLRPQAPSTPGVTS